MEDKRHASSQVTTSGIYLKPHYLGATFALWYCFFVQGGLLTRLPLVGKGPRFSLSLHVETRRTGDGSACGRRSRERIALKRRFARRLKAPL